jgi:5-(carboxyamino)imidazole ribonucleotide synthase
MKVGILGGGQLARMLSLAAEPLGIQTICLDPSAHVSANEVTQVVTADYQDEAQVAQWLKSCDLVTYETENIPAKVAKFIHQFKPLYPSVKALEMSQDRLSEKSLFQSLGINTPRFIPVNSLAELKTAVAAVFLPAILKTRRFGYDGKGQYLIHQKSDIEAAWKTLGVHTELILEEFIRFDRELSLIGVRNQAGEMRFYPLTENHHQQGILRTSQAPYRDELLQAQAESYVEKLFLQLDYVGVLSVEFFCVGEQLLASEMAPRVHNSGHWTIEGAETSQFENHIRAICNLPLGSTQARAHNFMLNCIGEEPNRQQVLAIPGVHYHTYDKPARPNRKLAHITLSSDDAEFFQMSLSQLKALDCFPKLK